MGDPSVDGRIILRRLFKNWDVGVRTGSRWLRIATGVGTFEFGNDLSGYTKYGEFLD